MTDNRRWNAYYKQGGDFKKPNVALIQNKLIDVLGSIGSMNHVDLGCGTGYLTRQFAQYNCYGQGIDSSPEAVRRARLLGRSTLYTYQTQDVTDPTLSVWQNPIDLLTCCQVYRFIEDKEQLVTNISTSLSTSGLFVLVDPHRKRADQNSHRDIYPSREDYKIISSTFKPVHHEQDEYYDYRFLAPS